VCDNLSVFIFYLFLANKWGVYSNSSILNSSISSQNSIWEC